MTTQASLTGVPETLLLTVYHRALETRRPDRLFRDDYAVSFVDRIDHDFSRFDDWRMEWAIPVRTWLIDAAVRGFLDRNRGGTVVTLGAGLCARALRLDNGRARWFSVDLESVGPLWRSLIGDSARNRFVAADVTDLSWTERIAEDARDGPLLFLSEGLFQYLPEETVREVVVSMRRRFPGAELIVDVLGDFTVRNKRLTPSIAVTGSVLRWGLNDCAEMETWASGLELLDQWYLLDYGRERQGYLGRLPGMFGGKDRFDKVARLRLGISPA
jgi:methyltransferase (TIGR00027 family)